MGSCAALVLVALVVGAEALTPFKQNYCRNRRPSECCRGVRDDDCTVPIYDTVCYCDDFCLDTDERLGGEEDCCPDFREVCMGINQSEDLVQNEGPETTGVCYYKGGYLPNGVYTFNCNKCTCKDTTLTCGDDGKPDECLVDEEIIEEVNSDPRRYHWTASNYSMFWGRKAREGLTLRTGTFPSDDKTRALNSIVIRPVDPIPVEFDARVKWGGLISDVRDQGWCGASWAFSTLGVAQDRQMILSGNPSLSLAPQQLLSCINKRGGNCLGGYVDHAWMFLRKLGVVEETCYSYQSGQYGEVPPCQRSSRFSACKAHKMEPAYRISSKVQDIQREIMTDGPVQAVMTVHRDFFMYSSGVYQCPRTKKGETSMHSVRILGWGEDTTYGNLPIKYWLVANSWGTQWGENGLFRIQQGAGDASCGIEDFVLATRGRSDLYA